MTQPTELCPEIQEEIPDPKVIQHMLEDMEQKRAEVLHVENMIQKRQQLQRIAESDAEQRAARKFDEDMRKTQIESLRIEEVICARRKLTRTIEQNMGRQIAGHRHQGVYDRALEALSIKTAVWEQQQRQNLKNDEAKREAARSALAKKRQSAAEMHCLENEILERQLGAKRAAEQEAAGKHFRTAVRKWKDEYRRQV